MSEVTVIKPDVMNFISLPYLKKIYFSVRPPGFLSTIAVYEGVNKHGIVCFQSYKKIWVEPTCNIIVKQNVFSYFLSAFEGDTKEPIHIYTSELGSIFRREFTFELKGN